jgi:trimeric autotransporter adhesin
MELHQYWRISTFFNFVVFVSLIAAASLPVSAQIDADATVPMKVNFIGILTGPNGKPLTTITIVTFSLYADKIGWEVLWRETVSVQPDSTGHYSVVLGSTTIQGLPANLFVAGQARWLGVRTKGQKELPRIMMVGIPYATWGSCPPPDPGGMSLLLPGLWRNSR